eukprot:3425986-Prymnesium_polylepis.1
MRNGAQKCCQMILKARRSQLGDEKFSETHVSDLFFFVTQPPEHYDILAGVRVLLKAGVDPNARCDLSEMVKRTVAAARQANAGPVVINVDEMVSDETTLPLVRYGRAPSP